MELDQQQRALDFVNLDAGSEWAARAGAYVLLRQGKLAEARQSILKASSNPLAGRDLLEVCLDPGRQTSQLDRIAQKMEAAALENTDAEPRYIIAASLAYCDQKDAAVRLLKSAIERNYCAYTALQKDPLLVKLRATPEFSGLLSEAKQCQDRFLAQRDQTPQ